MTTVPPPVPEVAAQLRAAMAHVPAAVSVVTTAVDGVPHGTTVSAFMSLSMDPPMLLVSLDNRSMLLSTIEVGTAVGVNVLKHEQAEIAERFARKDKAGAWRDGWHLDGSTPPRLDGCLAWVHLRVTDLVGAGDHTLVLGAVEAAAEHGGAPLVYWRRTYGTHSHA